MKLTGAQREILDLSLRSKTFLSGPAGCGKTTVGVEHMLSLLAHGAAPDSILVLAAQRTLQTPYVKALENPALGLSGEVSLLTVGGLARRMVDLFWPLVTESTGFAGPGNGPVFLNSETAQYYMSRLVLPLLDEGFFASVTIDHNRLYRQILDNLDKAAVVGFDHTEIGERLSAAWVGDPGQQRVYADVQECANRFRQFCLDHNLLDFSLLMETFWKVVWRTPECSEYLAGQYHHLIYDNVEEDFPIAHDLTSEWLPAFDSALVICDSEGGYRTFLGADPRSADRFSGLCDERHVLDRSFVTSPSVEALQAGLSARLLGEDTAPATPASLEALVVPSTQVPTRFFPQMIDWVAGEINHLINEEGLPPSEIVVLAPYLSDSLRFSLSHRLDELGIVWRSHRPSRSLREEPATHCLVTLAELAHQGWGIHPTKFDVAYALVFCIEGMDLVRAQLLSEIVYRQKDFSLSSFTAIRPEVQERITYILGERYEQVRQWMEAYRQETPAPPLDHFLRRFFGEVLSQKGFGFHRNNDAARTASNLIDSINNFRMVVESVDAGAEGADLQVGQEYVAMLQDGVLAAQYIEAWMVEADQGVLLAPAYTFLMMNRPVSVQFWLDAGSNGWWERLYQPLTHPYVLTRWWERDRQWTDADEQAANQRALANLIGGLLRRCRNRVYVGVSDLGESGFEQRGPFLKTIWKMQLESQIHESE